MITDNKPITTLRIMYNKDWIICCDSRSLNISNEKVLNVVKAPQNPTVKAKLTGNTATINDVKIVILHQKQVNNKKQPKMFIENVAIGKSISP